MTNTAHISIVDFWPPELRENKLLLFQAGQVVVICYNSLSRITQDQFPVRLMDRQGNASKQAAMGQGQSWVRDEGPESLLRDQILKQKTSSLA